MAKRSQFKMSVSDRRRRSFSESFKKAKVQDIERGLVTISELCKAYEVSNTAVYRWLKLYGCNQEKKERMIVETKSDTQALLALKQQVAELERKVGKKQIMIDFQNAMIELAEETYGIIIKKNSSFQPSDTFGSTGSSTPSV
jgi:transposase-like protein